MEELSRKAVACKHWQWMTGMVVKRGPCLGVITDGGKDWIVAEFFGPTKDGGGHYDGEVTEDILPMLEEPSTMGCVVHLVRKAWKDADFAIYKPGGTWTGLIHVKGENYLFSLKPDGYSEAETLIYILENAP
jgi:hypothetical protein